MAAPARSERKRNFHEREVWKALGFLVLLAVALYVAVRYRPEKLPVARIGLPPGQTRSAEETAGSAGYFAEFRMEREKLYQKQISLVREMLDRSDLEPDFRQAYQARYLALVDSMEKELEIEGILKTKGCDAVAFLTPGSCTVAVRCKELTADQVVVIADVIQRVTGLGPDKIAVVVSGDE